MTNMEKRTGEGLKKSTIGFCDPNHPPNGPLRIRTGSTRPRNAGVRTHHDPISLRDQPPLAGRAFDGRLRTPGTYGDDHGQFASGWVGPMKICSLRDFRVFGAVDGFP